MHDDHHVAVRPHRRQAGKRAGWNPGIVVPCRSARQEPSRFSPCGVCFRCAWRWRSTFLNAPIIRRSGFCLIWTLFSLVNPCVTEPRARVGLFLLLVRAHLPGRHCCYKHAAFVSPIVQQRLPGCAHGVTPLGQPPFPPRKPLAAQRPLGSCSTLYRGAVTGAVDYSVRQAVGLGYGRGERVKQTSRQKKRG